MNDKNVGQAIPFNSRKEKLPKPKQFVIQNWRVVEDGRKRHLQYKGETKFTFNFSNNEQYRLFDILFANEDQWVEYANLALYAMEKPYPEKRADYHKEIRRQLYHLQTRLSHLPLVIEIEGGARLRISDSYDFTIKDGIDWEKYE